MQRKKKFRENEVVQKLDEGVETPEFQCLRNVKNMTLLTKLITSSFYFK